MRFRGRTWPAGVVLLAIWAFGPVGWQASADSGSSRGLGSPGALGTGGAAGRGPTDAGTQIGTDDRLGNGCATVTVDGSGGYSVVFESPSWTFSGTLGAVASGISSSTGSDGLGDYCDTTFAHSADGDRRCRIRAYAATPVVLFSESSTASVQNTRRFPRLSGIPKVPHHMTYGGGGGFNKDFIQYSQSEYIPDSPFVYFDDAANTFIIGGASHFPSTQTEASEDTIVSGIRSSIETLPPGFEVRTILVASTSFNRAFESWGQALLEFAGKTPVANDATTLLERWTGPSI